MFDISVNSFVYKCSVFLLFSPCVPSLSLSLTLSPSLSLCPTKFFVVRRTASSPSVSLFIFSQDFQSFRFHCHFSTKRPSEKDFLQKSFFLENNGGGLRTFYKGCRFKFCYFLRSQLAVAAQVAAQVAAHSATDREVSSSNLHKKLVLFFSVASIIINDYWK